MYFEARYPSLMAGCSMRWNYFSSSHGKGIYYPLEAFLFIIVHFIIIHINSLNGLIFLFAKKATW
jgi:hypothetical protein